MTTGGPVGFAKLDELSLDSKNPRLGRAYTSKNLSQEQILKIMERWALDELAESFLESGFWPQEPLIVVEEEQESKRPRKIVVEGNRRLATLKFLKRAVQGDEPVPRKFRLLVARKTPPSELFEKIPYVVVDSREVLDGFLGFRHVTGIKEWHPTEKAEFIVNLVDNKGLSFDEVMRKIGSKRDPVRRNYFAYKILLQMEDHNDFDLDKIEKRFSLLFLVIREEGARRFLGIDLTKDPSKNSYVIDNEHTGALRDLAKWLFGSGDYDSVVPESRRIGDFARILESEEALQYLRDSREPNFDFAYQLSGGDVEEVASLIRDASKSISLASSRLSQVRHDEQVVRAATDLLRSLFNIKAILPDLWNKELDITK